MLCNSCQKLALIPAMRTCVRCKGKIAFNLNVICDLCSTSEKVCSVCLKKLFVDGNKPKRGCRSCGSK